MYLDLDPSGVIPGYGVVTRLRQGTLHCITEMIDDQASEVCSFMFSMRGTSVNV